MYTHMQYDFILTQRVEALHKTSSSVFYLWTSTKTLFLQFNKQEKTQKTQNLSIALSLSFCHYYSINGWLI